MKMHALSYIIKYLPCLIVNFQAAIHKNLPLARCKAFEHGEPTNIYIINISFFFFFLNWDSLHARLNSHYQAWSYKKRSTKKITGYRKSV